jgi:hypothetical protein
MEKRKKKRKKLKHYRDPSRFDTRFNGISSLDLLRPLGCLALKFKDHYFSALLTADLAFQVQEEAKERKRVQCWR